jgi:hypothetical protein
MIISVAFLLLVVGAALQPILARHKSRCTLCDHLIEDEEIVEVDGEWVHADCADDLDDEEWDAMEGHP